MKDFEISHWRLVGFAFILIGMSFALGHTIGGNQASDVIESREVRLSTQAERIKELDNELLRQRSLYSGLEEAYSELSK